jgi:hypothetical protein
MIYYEIFPYLDYDSRVTANLLLPWKDRLQIQPRKRALLEFQYMLNLTMMRSLLKNQQKAKNKITRSRLILKLWRKMPLLTTLYQHNASFRKTVAAKAVELSDPTFAGLDQTSTYTRKTLKALCQGFLLSLETSYPYIGEMEFSFSQEGEWSAVHTL